MILCLVTDRRRLGAALGAGCAEWISALRTQVAVAAAVGVDLIQVREPDLEAGELVQLIRLLVADTRHTRARIVVNDRFDVAVASGAAGVHLKERSFTPVFVRRFSKAGFLIGRSVHGLAGTDDVPAADYLIAGTVLPTVSKPLAARLGWAGLAEIVRHSTGRPVLAIGGIQVSSMPELTATGAAGLAAIGAFVPGPGEDLARFVRKRVMDMRLGFDTARSLS